MKIYTDTPEGSTVIQNSFIDQYMPHANGEFVKVYLYLLRCANTGRELSVSSIADVFEHTEKDVQRALAYWEKQGLLRLKASSDGTVRSLTFTDPARCASAGEAGTRKKAAAGDNGGESAAEPVRAGEASREKEQGKKKPDQLSDRARQELSQLFFVAEQYLQRPLTSSEQNDLVYYYDTLQFSFDLIEYLLEYCISKGSSSRHYMRRVALAWAEAGITTVREAKQESTLYNKNYFTILKAFGIKGRNPAPPEQEMMSRWLNDLGFSIEIVLEACRRTICQTHQPNFQYADKILTQWNSQKVRSMKDIEALDQKRMQDKAAAKQASQKQAVPQRTAGNRFNNFSQREYDYSELEKKLLGQQ